MKRSVHVARPFRDRWCRVGRRRLGPGAGRPAGTAGHRAGRRARRGRSSSAAPGQGRGFAPVQIGPSAPVPPEVAIPRPTPAELAQVNDAVKKFIDARQVVDASRC